MANNFLSTDSPYTFVWHDNNGQVIPENTAQLSTSINTTGFTLNIAANSIIDDPIILLSSSALGNKSQNVINIGKAAQVQIIEYLLNDDQNSTNNVNTIINCSDAAQLQHCILQTATENANIRQHSITAIKQASGSKVTTNIFAFGGNLNRIELDIALQGQGAECTASCLAYTHGSENQEVALTINHMYPGCVSKSLSRSVLKDSSTTDFIGKIVVHPDAARSLADLQIKNLLCSNKARATNKPELEIFNDDVKCSHGSSTGRLDENALFYCRSRGIDLATATGMLITGFIAPAIQSCKIPNLAEFVLNTIAERT